MLDTKALAEATALIVKEHVAAAIAPLLAEIAALRDREPVAGERGADGRDGRDADPVEVERLIEAAVSKAVAMIPAPRDGVDGSPGADGEPGAPGSDGQSGADGKDGAGIADLLIDRAGSLVATFTDGRTKALGTVIGHDGDPGADGKAGADGRDGLNLEDFQAEVMDDGRTVRFAMTAGETQYAYQLSFPVVIDRGVYRDGQEYKQGDAVTWAGSLWIAQKDTASKPDSGDGWRLSVKRGRDGKDASALKS